MSEEEKKALKYMKEFQKDLYGASSKNLMASYLDTIFNLINNQQKEIEELKQPKYLYNANTGEITKLENSNYISKDKIRELINKRNAGIGYTSLECIEDIEKLLDE